MESLCANFIRHVCLYSCVFPTLYSVILSQILYLHEISIWTLFCNCSVPVSILIQYPVLTYQNTGEDRNENALLPNANAVCFGHFQGECYSFGEVLLFIRGVRISSEKCLLPSTNLSVCPSSYIGATPTAQIFVKFDIGDFHENLSRKIQIWLKSDRNIRHFT